MPNERRHVCARHKEVVLLRTPCVENSRNGELLEHLALNLAVQVGARGNDGRIGGQVRDGHGVANFQREEPCLLKAHEKLALGARHGSFYLPVRTRLACFLQVAPGNYDGGIVYRSRFVTVRNLAFHTAIDFVGRCFDLIG